MTIVFQGHISRLDLHSAPLGKVSVTLQTPMSETGGKEWNIYVPQAQAAHWLPGRVVSFTLYALATQDSGEGSKT